MKLHHVNVFIVLYFELLSLMLSLATDEILCNPSNQHNPKIKDFLAERWNAARAELGMPKISKQLLLNGIFLGRFYNYTTGVVFWNIGGTIFSYARIYKCANEGVVRNFDEHAIETGSPKKTPQMVLGHPEDVDRFKSDVKYDKLKQYPIYFDNTTEGFKNAARIPTFTFVRDPLQRFESSLAEAVWRTDLYQSRHNMPKYIVDSTDMVKGYIREILNRQPSSLRDIQHVFTMSGVLFRFHIDIVGYLESFRDDLLNKVLPAYEENINYNHRYGYHATSVNHPLAINIRDQRSRIYIGDVNNLRYYFKQLIQEEPAYHRALCNIYLIDYVCLPKFELPPECQYLEPIRAEGVEILTSNNTQ